MESFDQTPENITSTFTTGSAYLFYTPGYDESRKHYNIILAQNDYFIVIGTCHSNYNFLQYFQKENNLSTKAIIEINFQVYSPPLNQKTYVNTDYIQTIDKSQFEKIIAESECQFKLTKTDMNKIGIGINHAKDLSAELKGMIRQAIRNYPEESV